MSLEAKDLYITNHYGEGYNPRYSKGENKGDYVMSKFKAVLDYSLELIKLREVYEKVYRNTRFTFERNNREFTNRVINLTFKYSVKKFNKLGENVYVKLGTKYEDIEFNDCVYLVDGELKAIMVDYDVVSPIDQEVLGKYFRYDNGRYCTNDDIDTVVNVTDLRNMLYQDGFICDGIKYIRYKRSPGSSRVGKCLFIDEKLYSRMHRWELCGFKIKEGEEVDLASLEAYISLTLSSIIDTLEIYPENILVIDDYESVFNERVVETSLENSKLTTEEKDAVISNSIWDGQSLMDKSLFGVYEKKGMVLLRNQFFKSCCFNANIQKWFQDNLITDLSQINGRTRAKSIEDIKLITTPSSIKYLKFGSLDDWFDNIEPNFGVVKYEKKTHHIEGNCVQTHYQLLNTLQMTYEEVEELLKPNLDYLNLIKLDPAVLRFHIKHTNTPDSTLTPLESKNDIIYKLLGLNDEFANTKMYYDFKQDLVKSIIKTYRKGHLYIQGNYSTLCGNPIEMLKMAIGTFRGKSELGVGNVCSSRFEYNQTLLGCRSPHVTIGNLWLPNNVRNEDVDIYMNSTNEIIYINSIGENVLERLSGADFDSDTVLLTDNKLLIDCARKNYDKFLTPTNNVKSIKTKRTYTLSQKSDLDIKSSSNKIGEIVNLSQELNTLLWDKLNSGDEDIMDIYYDVCQLDVMSNLAIDQAKKEFDLNMNNELKRLRIKYHREDRNAKNIKPYFFAHISKLKGYYNPTKNSYAVHKSTMDYLEKIINSYQRKRIDKKNKFIQFYQILDTSDYDIKKAKYDQVNRIIDIVTSLKNKGKEIFSNQDEGNYEEYIIQRQECIDYVGKIKFNKNTMIYMLSVLDTDKYKYVYRMVFNILFGYPNTDFYEVIVENKEDLECLKRDFDNNEKTGNFYYIFGLKYKKICKNR